MFKETMVQCPDGSPSKNLDAFCLLPDQFAKIKDLFDQFLLEFKKFYCNGIVYSTENLKQLVCSPEGRFGGFGDLIISVQYDKKTSFSSFIVKTTSTMPRFKSISCTYIDLNNKYISPLYCMDENFSRIYEYSNSEAKTKFKSNSKPQETASSESESKPEAAKTVPPASKNKPEATKTAPPESESKSEAKIHDKDCSMGALVAGAVTGIGLAAFYAKRRADQSKLQKTNDLQPNSPTSEKTFKANTPIM
jgi:hypothetical protein